MIMPESRAAWLFDDLIVWSDGRVSTTNNVFLQPDLYGKHNGTPIYQLWHQGKRLSVYLWMLLFRSFVENYDRFKVEKVSFVDGDPTNCALENLVFLAREGDEYRELPIRSYVNSYGKKVYSVDNRLKHRILVVETGAIYRTLKEAAADTGIPPSNISAVLNGRRQKAGGYRFLYYTPE